MIDADFTQFPMPTVAVHEAGHAVAAVKLDLPFEFVSIDPAKFK